MKLFVKMRGPCKGLPNRVLRVHSSLEESGQTTHYMAAIDTGGDWQATWHMCGIDLREGWSAGGSLGDSRNGSRASLGSLQKLLRGGVASRRPQELQGSKTRAPGLQWAAASSSGAR